jgi:hypothetical protein
MGDVVFEHLVLRLQSGELGDKTGVAGWVEDNVSHAEQGEARRSGEKNGGSDNEPLAMFLEFERHNASLGLIERLQTLRAGWVQPVQVETLAVVHDPAR